MTQAELRKDYEVIKGMNFRLCPDRATKKERNDFYEVTTRFIDKIKKWICDDSEEDSEVISARDFWWVESCKIILHNITQRREELSFQERAFSDAYIDVLLQHMKRAMEKGQLLSTVCVDIRGNQIKGYKVYERLDGKWYGLAYTKLIQKS